MSIVENEAPEAATWKLKPEPAQPVDCREAFEKWLDEIKVTEGSPTGNWVDDCKIAFEAAWNAREKCKN